MMCDTLRDGERSKKHRKGEEDEIFSKVTTARHVKFDELEI